MSPSVINQTQIYELLVQVVSDSDNIPQSLHAFQSGTEQWHCWPMPLSSLKQATRAEQYRWRGKHFALDDVCSLHWTMFVHYKRALVDNLKLTWPTKLLDYGARILFDESIQDFLDFLPPRTNTELDSVALFKRLL